MEFEPQPKIESEGSPAHNILYCNHQVNKRQREQYQKQKKHIKNLIEIVKEIRVY